MELKFRVFVVRHASGSYTLTLPGVESIEISDAWSDDTIPATSTLSAHGMVLDELKEDLKEALEMRLARVEPGELGTISNYREGQYIEKLEFDLRPSNWEGKKRRSKVRMAVSLMIVKEDDGQYLVTVPKFTYTRLSFYVYNLDELAETSTHELVQHFDGDSLDDILEYSYGRQEYLDELTVTFKPLNAKDQRKKKKDEDDTQFWALRQSAINLTARVASNGIGKAYGREKEVSDLLAILASPTMSSVLLTGPSGSGKTAIIHEIARRIKDGNCPDQLKDRQVWATTSTELISGCSYLGQWEEKLKDVVNEVKKRRHIIVIDDLVGLMEAGKWSKGDENMARFLRPYLADGTLTVIGESSEARLSVGEKADPAFLAQFRQFIVPEMDRDRTSSVLVKTAAELERRHKARIEPAAIEASIDLTRRFQPYRVFPGKAIEFLTRAVNDLSAAKPENLVVNASNTITAFSHQTGLPEFLLSDRMTLEPASIERFFGQKLIGQPGAVGAIVDLITIIKAGLNDPNKPLGVFLCVGPTGVGKTELCKVLAEYLFGDRSRMLRFDMSEYGEPMTVPKLIGSAYGSDEGELTRKIRLNPFSVVLLDEFEKAHSSVFDIMLQVFGEGRLTDANGRTADFRSCVVLMTSNLGASGSEQRSVGLRPSSSASNREAYFTKQVEKHFRPEFVNRLDKIIVFHPLDAEAVSAIATREINLLFERDGITRRRLLVDVAPEVLDKVTAAGFSPTYGARPLKREIERQIITPLARYLVANRESSPRVISLSVKDGSIHIKSSELSRSQAGITEPRSKYDEAQFARLTMPQLAERIARARLTLHNWSEGGRVQEIDREYRQLLATTRSRSFENYGADAHRTWKRIYELERLVKRVEQLRRRAEYLEEFVVLAMREPAQRYTSELASNCNELQMDVDYLHLELRSVDHSEVTDATLTIAPIGRTARTPALRQWIASLAEMYILWAKQKGYEVKVSAPAGPYVAWLENRGQSPHGRISDFDAGPPMKPDFVPLDVADVAAAIKLLSEIDAEQYRIEIKGVNVFSFLKGEGGIHKRIDRGDDHEAPSPFCAALVHVARETATSTERTGKDVENDPAVEDIGRDERIARVYQFSGDKFVRDPGTGAETTAIKDVMQGKIDSFILAATELDDDNDES